MNAMDFSDLLLNVHEIFERDRRKRSRGKRAPSICWSMNTRTPTACSTCWCARSPRAARQSVRGRRRGSIDLPLARRRHPQHPRFRARLSRGAHFQVEQNYRSTKTILAAADTVIRNNRERKEKLCGPITCGEPVTYFTGVTERDEADFIAREIGRLGAEGIAEPADIVVFYRVNAQVTGDRGGAGAPARPVLRGRRTALL